MKSLSELTVLTFAVVVVNISAIAQPVEMPFQLYGHLIVVKGSVDSARDLNLVVDTGASYSVISRQLCRTLKIRTRRTEAVSYGSRAQFEIGRLEEIRLGSTTFSDVEVMVANLNIADGLRVDLLLGLDLLKRNNLTIDYQKQTLIVGSDEEYSQNAGFYPNLPFLLIKLQVQGKSLNLILDTGSANLVLFEQKIKGRLKLTHTRERRRIAHVAGYLTLKKILVDDTHLADASLGTVSAYLMAVQAEMYGGADGLFSPTSLKLRKLHLDFTKHQIGWEL